MCRSLKKCNFVHKSLFKKSMQKREKSKIHSRMVKFFVDKKAKIFPSSILWKRNSLINNNLLNKKLAIYNGYKFVIANISTKHKGFKLGELSVTKRKPKHKGKKRQKKIKERIALNLLQQKKLKEKKIKKK